MCLKSWKSYTDELKTRQQEADDKNASFYEEMSTDSQGFYEKDQKEFEEEMLKIQMDDMKEKNRKKRENLKDGQKDDRDDEEEDDDDSSISIHSSKHSDSDE